MLCINCYAGQYYPVCNLSKNNYLISKKNIRINVIYIFAVYDGDVMVDVNCKNEIMNPDWSDIDKNIHDNSLDEFNSVMSKDADLGGAEYKMDVTGDFIKKNDKNKNGLLGRSQKTIGYFFVKKVWSYVRINK